MRGKHTCDKKDENNTKTVEKTIGNSIVLIDRKP